MALCGVTEVTAENTQVLRTNATVILFWLSYQHGHGATDIPAGKPYRQKIAK